MLVIEHHMHILVDTHCLPVYAFLLTRREYNYEEYTLPFKLIREAYVDEGLCIQSVFFPNSMYLLVPTKIRWIPKLVIAMAFERRSWSTSQTNPTDEWQDYLTASLLSLGSYLTLRKWYFGGYTYPVARSWFRAFLFSRCLSFVSLQHILSEHSDITAFNSTRKHIGKLLAYKPLIWSWTKFNSLDRT